MGEQDRFSFTFCAARVGRPVARLLLLRPDLHLFFASREEFDKKSRWFLITSPNTRSLTLARLIWVVDTSLCQKMKCLVSWPCENNMALEAVERSEDRRLLAHDHPNRCSYRNSHRVGSRGPMVVLQHFLHTGPCCCCHRCNWCSCLCLEGRN